MQNYKVQKHRKHSSGSDSDGLTAGVDAYAFRRDVPFLVPPTCPGLKFAVPDDFSTCSRSESESQSHCPEPNEWKKICCGTDFHSKCPDMHRTCTGGKCKRGVCPCKGKKGCRRSHSSDSSSSVTPPHVIPLQPTGQNQNEI